MDSKKSLKSELCFVFPYQHIIMYLIYIINWGVPLEEV